MPDLDTLALMVLPVLALGTLLAGLDRIGARSRVRDRSPAARRRRHAAAARSSTSMAMVCVGLLLVALVLGRLLLGVMALTGLVVFAALAVVRSTLSR
ncbi:MAG: hypothetical protein WB441_15470 [Nocardioidaceae bacterium]